MEYKTIEEVYDKFAKYEPLSDVDKINSKSYWYEYEPLPVMGEWILFKHVKTIYPKGVEYESLISKPILGLVVGHTVWDQALVLEYVTEWRGFEVNSEVFTGGYYDSIALGDKKVKHIQFWTDNIIVLGHWKTKPTFFELRQSFKNY